MNNRTKNYFSKEDTQITTDTKKIVNITRHWKNICKSKYHLTKIGYY